MQGRHDWLSPPSPLRMGPSTPRKAVTLLVGGPGSGKGTIGVDIARQLGCSEILTMSDILRQRQQQDAAEVAVPSGSGDSLTSSAKLVGDGLACSAFEGLLLTPKHSNIMVDGFPRSQAQARRNPPPPPPTPWSCCSHPRTPNITRAPASATTPSAYVHDSRYSRALCSAGGVCDATSFELTAMQFHQP